MIVTTKYDSVFVDICDVSYSFKTIEKLNSGKNKVRRRVFGRPVKGRTGIPKRDHFGNIILKAFNDIEDANRNAINFVDNFLILSKD